jgi:NAD(P)-dependent dehydrogenase (short-subunit alcohol dehydrogenase family)
MARTAIVTGANRGIGLEVCRQLTQRGFTVILGARDLAKGEQAAASLGMGVLARQLDVSDHASVERLRQQVEREWGALDVLVNNAAIHYDYHQGTTVDADLQIVQEAFDTNLLGAWRMARAFVPLIRRGTQRRIVNVSSEAGAFGSLDYHSPAYNISKAALNALTVMLAKELRRDKILVNAVCPGWVATDMGGAGGRPIPEGAASVVWAVMLPDDGATGGFFRDGNLLQW